MTDYFLKYLETPGITVQYDGNNLVFSDGKTCPVKNGIPRFTPDLTYVSGNFSVLRERHSLLQFDSVNGSNDRMLTILGRTKWDESFFKGKTILECGCGAGPDTEILLRLGATVIAVDLAGLDIAKKNLNNNPSVQHVQASIANLPFREKSFDVVFCHRVIQHTPDPEKILDHILKFVKNDGAVFIHSYANSFVQKFRWKYFLRPLTKNMQPEKLYYTIKKYSKFLFNITSPLEKFFIGRAFNWVFVPFHNYRNYPKFRHLPDDFIIEYGIHDTFDALSPSYDKPLSAITMRKFAEKHLMQPYEIEQRKTVTLLRSVIPK